METYGSQLLVEMGTVFKSLYLDKQQHYGKISKQEEISEQENTKIDIVQCLCVLFAVSQSAKTQAVEQNMVKKIVEICEENSGAVNLSEIQKIKKSIGKGNNKSGNKS